MTDDAKLAECNCGGKGWTECPACRGGMETIWAKCSTCKGEGSFPCTCAKLAEIRARRGKITNLPWWRTDPPWGNGTTVHAGPSDDPHTAACFICDGDIVADGMTAEEVAENMDFIAHAPTDIDTLLSHLAAALEQPQYVKCSGCGCGILKSATKQGTNGPICIDPATCVSQQRTVDAITDCRTDDGCGECLKCLRERAERAEVGLAKMRSSGPQTFIPASVSDLCGKNSCLNAAEFKGMVGNLNVLACSEHVGELESQPVRIVPTPTPAATEGE